MNKNKIVIRRPKRDDINKIEAFFELILRDTFAQNGISHLEESFEEELTDKKFYLLKDFETDGIERYFLFAEYEGKIIGSIAYGPSNDLINTYTNNKLQSTLEMGSVYIHPDYQRMGIVSLLIHALLSKLKADGIKTFCFDSGYPIAQHVWCKKMGQPKYIEKDCWGEDIHHMIWYMDVETALQLIEK